MQEVFGENLERVLTEDEDFSAGEKQLFAIARALL
eukprot:GSA120T00006090001.1